MLAGFSYLMNDRVAVLKDLLGVWMIMVEGCMRRLRASLFMEQFYWSNLASEGGLLCSSWGVGGQRARKQALVAHAGVQECTQTELYIHNGQILLVHLDRTGDSYLYPSGIFCSSFLLLLLCGCMVQQVFLLFFLFSVASRSFSLLA